MLRRYCDIISKMTQTLTIRKRRFVLVPEKEFQRLQKRAEHQVRPEFGREAMIALRDYKKSGKAAKWADVQRKLGLVMLNGTL
jgi:hypothetical protein